ncbi:hypothetical protein BC829DRAFT_436614 [Chytridium lagenaria]|nr:hypothetical protein BC829DRAFT_436614 [Chytridium lagenaria]
MGIQTAIPPSPPTPMLLGLPPELIFAITSYLDISAFLTLSSSCRAARSTILLGDAGNLCTMTITSCDPLPAAILKAVQGALKTASTESDAKNSGHGGTAEVWDDDAASSCETMVEVDIEQEEDVQEDQDDGKNDTRIPPIASVSLPDGSVWISPFSDTLCRLTNLLVTDTIPTKLAESMILKGTLDNSHSFPQPAEPLESYHTLLDFICDGIRKLDRSGLRIRFNPLPLSQFFDISLQVRKYDSLETLHGPVENDDVDMDTISHPHPNQQTHPAEHLPTTITPPSTRRVYKGMRHYFSRSVHSRLPLHLIPLTKSQPIPTSLTTPYDPTSGFFYYEVTIIPIPNTPPTPLHARIGVSLSNSSSHHLPGSLPNSLGYQSEDGFLALGHRDGETYQFAPPYTYGDVIGCGFVPQTTMKAPHSTQGVVFFTKNGEWVGDAPHRIDRTIKGFRSAWHACAGASGPVDMEFNLLGEFAGGVEKKRFLYEPANDMMRIRMEGLNIMKRGLSDGRHYTGKMQCVKDVIPVPPHLRRRFWEDGDDGGMNSLEKKGLKEWLIKPLVATIYDERVDPYLRPHRIIDTDDDNLFTELIPTSDPPRSPHIYEFPNNGPMVPRVLQSPTPLRRPMNQTDDPPPGTYFEVTILEGGDPLTFIAVGLAVHPYSAFHHVGWDFGSVGYHSDDGRIYDGTNQGGRGVDEDCLCDTTTSTISSVTSSPRSFTALPVPPSTRRSSAFFPDAPRCRIHSTIVAVAATLETSYRFGRGDTVGVGVDGRGDVFVTLNGRWVGRRGRGL